MVVATSGSQSPSELGESKISLSLFTCNMWFMIVFMTFSRPSIHILELAKCADGEIVLTRCAEIMGAARVLYFKDMIIFFACMDGDDNWPIMMNWMSRQTTHIVYSGGSSLNDPYPLPLVSLIYHSALTYLLISYNLRIIAQGYVPGCRISWCSPIPGFTSIRNLP